MTAPAKPPELSVEEKRERVRQLLAKRNAAPRTHPLSFAQQRLWFLEQLDSGSATYTIPVAFRLRGPLDAEALTRALRELVARHAVLRTTFPAVDGEPVQRVQDAATLELPRVDLSGLSAAERDAEVARLSREESEKGFALERELPLRARLLRLSADEHVLLFTAHHIVWDAWSSGIFVRELSALYDAFSRGAPSPLPALTLQYGDFASWQRQWLQGDVLEQQLSFWRRHLAGAPPALDLPMDAARPPLQTYAGATVARDLGMGLSRRLRALAQRQGVTPFMLLLAAWQVLLQRYTQQDDFVVGTPIANRNRAQTEGLIGFFVNTLALRADLSGDPPFESLLGRVREASLGAFAHQDLPFERLVEALQVDRDLSRPPLFNVMFAFQNVPVGELAMRGLTLEVLELDAPVAKFDLTLTVREHGKRMEAQLELNTDLFARDRIERMAGHFHALLEDIVARPEQRVSELNLLPDEERHRLLWEWSGTPAPSSIPAEEASLPVLVAAQVARTPDAVAVVHGDTRLTYRELDARAEAIARWLWTLGVTPEEVVAVAMPRGVEWAVTLLAVWKAGAAFLPLDTTLPSRRLERLLEESRPRLVLSHRSVAHVVPDTGARLLWLDEAPELSEVPAPPLAPPPPGRLAYVIHTSGSTGAPKGVMISHRGICHRLLWEHRAHPLGPEDRVLQVASYAFDAFIWETFRPLIAGACCVIASQEDAKDAARLAELMARQGVTEAGFVPSLLEALLDEPAFARCTGLRRVVCAGEALSGALAERFLSALPARLENFYGQTEVSIDALSFPCERGPSTPTTIPIGRPLQGMRAYVLDARLVPVPTGVWGELYLAGPGLSRGYRWLPALTAEKFVPSPFGEGDRLFRTGDLARYRADGTLEFRGRTDHQVKVRGVRVELGEIEAVLKQHPRVRDAVVVSVQELPAALPASELERLLTEIEREVPG